MPPSLTLDDRHWFKDVYFKGKQNLNINSDITLRIITLFYPLGAAKQGLLSLGLLLCGALPFITPSAIANYPDFPDVPLAVVIFNVLVIPAHLLLRRYLIKGQYGLADSQYLKVNQRRIALSSLIRDGALPQVGHQEVDKYNISEISVEYGAKRRRYHVHAIQIRLTTGETITLKNVYYPLKHLLYLMVYFDYPIKFVNRRYFMSDIVRIMALLFPIAAHFSLTLLMVMPHISSQL